jgi:hypothetical protein
MNEEKFVTWLLGACMGALTVIGANRFLDDPQIVDVEAARAEELIKMYQRGKQDALRTNPVSFELEQVCLEVWANKQPLGN